MASGSPQLHPIAIENDELKLTIRQQRVLIRNKAALLGEKTSKYPVNPKVSDKLKFIKEKTSSYFKSEKQEATQHKTALKNWLETDGNFEADPWSHLLLSWCVTLLELGGSKKRVIRKSTVNDYLISVAEPILTVLTNDDYDLTEPDDWIEALNKVITLVKSPSRRVFVRYFANYLLQTKVAPEFELSELDIPSHQTQVDANILTCHEAEIVLQYFEAQTDITSQTARLLFCLGFFSGLRRQEASKLKLRDIQINGKLSEVHVRRNLQRELKSPQSARNVPLAPFWPEQEIKFLQYFVESALSERRIDQALFADQVIVSKAFTQLSDLLRQITAEPNFRFHHLRHSYANWMYWLLHAHQSEKKLPAICSTNFLEENKKHQAQHIAFLNHPWLSKEVAVALKERLGLTFALSRKKQFVLSHLLGHSSIETTCGSYLHLLDVFSYLFLSKNYQLSRPLLIQHFGYHAKVISLHPLQLKKSVSLLQQPTLLNHEQITKNVTIESSLPILRQHQAVAVETETKQVSLVQLANFMILHEKSLSAMAIASSLELTPAEIEKLIQCYQVTATRTEYKALFTKIKANNLTKKCTNNVVAWCEILEFENGVNALNQQAIKDLISIMIPGKGFLPRTDCVIKAAELLKLTHQLKIPPQQHAFRLLIANHTDSQKLRRGNFADAQFVAATAEDWINKLVKHINLKAASFECASLFQFTSKVSQQEFDKLPITVKLIQSKEVLYKNNPLLEVRILTSQKRLNKASHNQIDTRDKSLANLIKVLCLWFSWQKLKENNPN
ncbi:tyrosine-type recombinase/integrase [Alishewanella sp. HL-SH06]|uniref:tyrosine-type recombinase/integrase n=1 Tax=Alishewanella sp. HL-SH06 TaxID=3461144 RepID=UPI0040413E35